MNSSTPLVSAVVPAYNAARYIRHTLQSLVNQTYANLEIVVVDDGSVDATVPLVQEMARSHPQIRLIQQHNSGVAAARNRGIAESHGEFIAPVDADDIWFPEAAERLLRCLMQSDSGVGVAYGWSVTLDEAGHLDGGFRCSMIEGSVFNSLCAHNFIGNASSTMIRRACFQQVGGYDCQFREQNTQGCEDWDLYLRLAERCRFRVVPEFVIGYRRVADGMSANAASMARSHAHLLRKVSERHPRIPKILRRLSTSGFYLYLAEECQRRGAPLESKSWLRRAFVEGHIYTLVRPTWYTLLAQHTLAVFAKPAKQPARNINGEVRRMSSKTLQEGQETGIADMAAQRARIRMRIVMQNILHYVVGRLPTSLRDRSA